MSASPSRRTSWRSSNPRTLRLPSFIKETENMSFTNTPAITGTPVFETIDINTVEVAAALQVYLDRGSKLTGVDIKDINRNVSVLPADSSKVTLSELITKGMKLFDAIVWLSAGRPTAYPLIADKNLTEAKIPSAAQISRALFFVYFFLLTQARYPTAIPGQPEPKTPNFLTAVMGLNKSQQDYVDVICSFTPHQFDAKWIRYVKFPNFGQESLSRFGLGVAGYRMFTPFKLYPCKDDVSEDVRRAYDFAATVAKAQSTWSIHPLTRDPNILKNRGNLNKNLSNLILECFTQEQITEMITAKVIFGPPQRYATNREFRNWKRDDDVSGTEFIFMPGV